MHCARARHQQIQVSRRSSVPSPTLDTGGRATMNALEAALRSGHVRNDHLAAYDARVDATIFDCDAAAQQPWLQAEFLLSTSPAHQPGLAGAVQHGLPAPSTTSFASLVAAQLAGGGALTQGGVVHRQASHSAALGSSEAQAATAAGLGGHLHSVSAVQQQQQQQQHCLPGAAVHHAAPEPARPQAQLMLLQHQLWSLQHQAAVIMEQQAQQAPVTPASLALAAAHGDSGAAALLEVTQQLQQQQQQTAAQMPVADGPPARTNSGSLARKGKAPADRTAALPPLSKSGHSSRRHRERQRVLVTALESEVSERLAKLQLLSTENEMLKLRGAVLEAAVASREDQMRVTQEHGPPVYNATSVLDGVLGGDDGGEPAPARCESDGGGAAASPGGPATPAATCASGLSSDASPSSSSGAAAALARAASTSSTGGSGGQALRWPGGAAAPAGDDADWMDGEGAGVQQPRLSSGGGGHSRSGSGADLLPVNPAPLQHGQPLTVKAMGVEDVLFHWKVFLQDASRVLVEVQREEAAADAEAAGCSSSVSAFAGAAGGVSSAAQARIVELVDRATFLVRTAQTLNPAAYYRLFGRDLDTGLPAPYSDEHWRQVVSVLRLSKDQVTHILACAQLYFSNQSRLQHERRVLQQQIRAASCDAGGQAAALLRQPGDDDVMQHLLDKMAGNLKREHVLRVMLNAFVWGRIFSHVQCAKAAVYSHPFYVDVHALVCVMYEDALAAPEGSGAQRCFVFPHHSHPTPTSQLMGQLVA